MKRISISLFFIMFGYAAFCQTGNIQWYNPTKFDKRVVEGQGWTAQLLKPYDRLPAKAENVVRKEVWNLSRNSAGLMIRFRTNSSEIKVRYTAGPKHAMPHMPATGVSGVDLYAVSSDGEALWSGGKFTFGDTITYQFKGLIPNDKYHQLGREYRLYLPLYNSVDWLEIGVADDALYEQLAVRPELPIVVYGTSIAQGGCASRPGNAWTNILSRKMDRQVINLGFSGNGRLEPEVIDLVNEIEAKVYILDCMPNLIVHSDSKYTLEDVSNLILNSVKVLREKHPNTPIVLAQHAGYTDGAINTTRRQYFEEVNKVQQEAFEILKGNGVSGIYIISKETFRQDIETMVDGTHPNDIGMLRYAEGYEKELRKILNEPIGEVSTTKPVTQLRELHNYDWEKRHQAILDFENKKEIKTVVIGNSITHFWGGLPKGPRAPGASSWNTTFGERSLNMGYGWDRIENVLWRVYHGELDQVNPENIIINIGTNNLEHNSDAEILQGWELLIKAIKTRKPNAQIYMLGIYPRRAQEKRIANLNNGLKRIATEGNVHYADPGKVFLKNGVIDEAYFSDGLHPNAKGYEILGQQIKRDIAF